MLNFHYPKIEDKASIKDLLSRSQFQGCEYSFGNIFIWQNVFNTRVAKFKDFHIAKVGHKQNSYCFPAGKGNLEEVFNELKNDAKECGHPLRISSLTNQTIDLLENIMPNQFEYASYEKDFDYIYSVNDLIELPGRKFHSKRNHISYFEKNFNWSYEPINKNNIDECLEMNEFWKKQNTEKNGHDASGESLAIESTFKNFFDLDFVGGLIRIDNKVVAFTVGEELNNNTFCTHIEKADSNIRGAYPMINREFAKNALSQYEFVNREEDMGLPGLRKAKTSYHPIYLLEKYVAVYKGNL